MKIRSYKTKQNRNIGAMLLFVFCFCTFFANAQPRHFIGVWGGGGYSSLFHGIESSRVPGGAGFKFGLGYEAQFNERFLFQTGLEFQRLGSLTRLRDFGLDFEFYYQDGVETALMDWRYDFLEYSERHRVNFLNLPLMAGMRFDNGFYFLAGTKLGMGFSNTFRTDALIQTTITDPTAIDPWVGIFDLPPHTANGNLDLGFNVTASAEFGMILDEWLPRGWTQLNNRRRTPVSYRVGAFVDYGLLNLNQSSTTAPFMMPNATDPLRLDFNDLSRSTMANDRRFGSLHAGIKLTVLFDVSPQRRPPPPPIMFWARVIDAETQRPLDAEVTVRSGNRQIFRNRTDAGGFVSHEMRAGRYTVIAQADGYREFRQVVPHRQVDTLLVALNPIHFLTVRVINAETGENLAAELRLNNVAQANNPLVFSQMTDAETGMLRHELSAGRYSLQATAEGYLYYIETFEFTRSETRTIALQPIVIDVPVVLEDLFFAFASADILPDSEPVLDDLATFLTQNPDIKIHIVGHTDNVGTRAFNLILSENRARAVLDALVRRGINPDRLSSEGRAFDEPRDTNETEEGRARNRRVEFVIR